MSKWSSRFIAASVLAGGGGLALAGCLSSPTSQPPDDDDSPPPADGAVAPDEVFEGEQFIPVVVKGENLAGQEIEFALDEFLPGDLDCGLESTIASSDGSRLAKHLCVPVIEFYPQGADSQRITVTVPGTDIRDTIVVRGLDELDYPIAGSEISGERYSRIVLDAFAQAPAAGGEPLVVTATEAIYLEGGTGALDASELGFAGGLGGAPGADGEPGAGPGGGPGGDVAGSPGTGGSYSITRGAGTGYNTALLDEVAAGSPGSLLLGSGGGGGHGGDSSSGAQGGAGGGALILDSAYIVVEGRLSALGQVGQPGFSTEVTDLPCQGGGGSGGTIWLRARHLLDISAATIDVSGGGLYDNDPCVIDDAVHPGAPGRVRIDAHDGLYGTAGELEADIPVGSVGHGPLIGFGDGGDERIVDGNCSSAIARVAGEGTRSIFVNATFSGEVSSLPQELATASVDLSREGTDGRHRVCACIGSLASLPGDPGPQWNPVEHPRDRLCHCIEAACLE